MGLQSRESPACVIDRIFLSSSFVFFFVMQTAVQSKQNRENREDQIDWMDSPEENEKLPLRSIRKGDFWSPNYLFDYFAALPSKLRFIYIYIYYFASHCLCLEDHRVLRPKTEKLLVETEAFSAKIWTYFVLTEE